MEASSTPTVVQNWPVQHSPIRIDRLTPFLATHPDQDFATFIHHGLMQGFLIGYQARTDGLKASHKNHPSSVAAAAVVDERIASEPLAGRLLGPLPRNLEALVHTSPIGVIPKPHQPKKWRLIVDLSCPRGSSVNNGIPTDPCSLQYASVDDAVAIIQQLGRDTQLVKLDLKDAYRIVPAHPADFPLLGIRWRERVYIDRALPFGLRSAPKTLQRSR